jgi:peptide/nickel transport system permease protein
MTTSDTTITAQAASQSDGINLYRPSRSKRVRRLIRTQPLGAFFLLVIVALIVIAVFAPFFATHSPTTTGATNLESPSMDHWFGTDHLGRDIYSRVVHGSRTSLQVGIIATAIGVIGGAFIGLVSGYFGGWLDMFFQRIVDTLMAFPLLILALIMIAVVGPSMRNVMIVVGIGIMPGVSRIIRGIVLSEKENQYIEAAKTIGCSAPRILWRHLLPNLIAPIVVIASAVMPGAILVEAGLSFLGLGTPPPTPSWGGDLSGNAQRFFRHAPWMAIFPGLAISIVVLAFNLVGDAIRDIVDPRLRNR